jgi:hypothetical protein
MIESEAIWEETINKAKTDLKQNDDTYASEKKKIKDIHATNKKKIVNKLAKDLEVQGMQLGLIANKIVHSLADCNISRTYILDCLDKKYKREYNKIKQLSDDPKSIKDKNLLEQKLERPIKVLASGQSTNEPAQSQLQPNQVNEKDYEEYEETTKEEYEQIKLEQQQQRQEPVISQEFEKLKSEIRDRDIRIKNLEDQIKSINKRRNTFQYEDKEYVLDKHQFDNTIVVTKEHFNKFLEDLHKHLAGNRGLKYFLIQQDFDSRPAFRINFIKLSS